MKKNIMIVDDEPDVVEFLRNLLEDNGYEVSSAGNTKDAMKTIQNIKPDLIILDLLMPEETGSGFYRKLNEIHDFKSIPVIIVSGLTGKAARIAKSVPVLDKPIEQHRILSEIKKMLAAES